MKAEPSMLKTTLILFFLFSTSYSFLQDERTPLTHRLLNWVFPPNLDFRARTSSNDEPPATEGKGEKVKEAVAVSLGIGKATVEESAKSAADATKEKMQQTAQKLKDSFSSRQQSDEL